MAQSTHPSNPNPNPNPLALALALALALGRHLEDAEEHTPLALLPCSHELECAHHASPLLLQA